MDLGINELHEGLTLIRGRDKYMLPPSNFALAAVGMKKADELKELLEFFVENPNEETMPVFSRYSKRMSWEDLEARVRKGHEGMAKLLYDTMVEQGTMTGGGVWHFTVTRRGDERLERARHVVIVPRDGIENFSCQCPEGRFSDVKGNFDEEFGRFVTHVSCYHVSGALIRLGMSPYRMDERPDIVFEALARHFYKREKWAKIDRFALEQGVLNDDANLRIGRGEATVEVAKHSKNIPGRMQDIIKRTKTYLEKMGYAFAGFSTEFAGTQYQTTGIVFAKEDGKSAHILYDDAVCRLPYVGLKIPLHSFMEDGKMHLIETLAGNPVIFSRGKRYFREIDVRTQREAAMIIAPPPREALLSYERNLYY